MACSTCPGSTAISSFAPPRRLPNLPRTPARTGIQARVSTDAQVIELAKANPGHSVTKTVIGPGNIQVTLTPLRGR